MKTFERENCSFILDRDVNAAKKSSKEDSLDRIKPPSVGRGLTPAETRPPSPYDWR